MHTRVFMAAFTMMIMLSAALAGCINDDNSKISDMLIEVPFTGPVDERECFDFDNKERCWLIHIPETTRNHNSRTHLCLYLFPNSSFLIRYKYGKSIGRHLKR